MPSTLTPEEHWGNGHDAGQARTPVPGEAGRRARTDAYLADAALPERVTTLRPPDEVDASLLRWCYAFADQPDDGPAGLDWGEQFHGGTQLRYQLNSIAWAMSLYAANYLPNAPERTTEAMARVVRKHTDLRVWGYRRTLNLLGNFFPCEPGWSFTVCNVMGAQALHGHDTIHGCPQSAGSPSVATSPPHGIDSVLGWAANDDTSVGARRAAGQ